MMAAIAPAQELLPPGAIRAFRASSERRQIFFNAALSPDGKTLAVCGSTKRIFLFDVQTGKELLAFGSHIDHVWTVAWSRDGHDLASGGRGDLPLRRWDPRTGQELEPHIGHQGGITHVFFSRDGKRLFMSGGSWDPTIRVWDTATRKLLRSMAGHTDYINAMAVSPDERLIASGSQDGTLRLWDLERGKELAPFVTAHAGSGFSAVAFSPCGNMIASGARDGECTIWEVASRQARWRIKGRESCDLAAVVFTADGDQVIAGWNDGAIRIIDLRHARVTSEWPAQTDGVRSIVMHPSGTTFVTTGQEGVAYLWELPKRPSDAMPPSRQEQLELAWGHLAGEADRAYRAILQLSQRGSPVVPFLRSRLQPVAPADAAKVERLIADLDSPRFADRERATQEIALLGDRALMTLRQASAKAKSAEVRDRLARLLKPWDSPPRDGELLRQLRAVEILQRHGSPDAVVILRELSRGAVGARVTVAARTALIRLEPRDR